MMNTWNYTWRGLRVLVLALVLAASGLKPASAQTSSSGEWMPSVWISTINTSVSAEANADTEEQFLVVRGSGEVAHLVTEKTCCAVSAVLGRHWWIESPSEKVTVQLNFDCSSLGSQDLDLIGLLIDRGSPGISDDFPVYGYSQGRSVFFKDVTLKAGETFTLAVIRTRYYSVTSGSMSGVIWARTPGGIPTSIDRSCDQLDLHVTSGTQVVNDLPELHCHDIIVQSGAVLDLSDQSLYVSNTFETTGTILPGRSTLFLNGRTIQSISGTICDLNDLVCQNPEGVQLETSILRMHGTLDISCGTFHTGGRLTLVEDANSAGSIGSLVTGTLSGSITIEKSFVQKEAGWMGLCSPVQNKIVQDLNDDIITTGFRGADYPNYDFTNIQHYKESESGAQQLGFVGVEGDLESIPARSGYFVYMNAGTALVDLSGGACQGSMELPVNYTDTGDATADGWNFVGNPYPSAVNWDSREGWTRFNTSEALYTWNATRGQYSSYIRGIGNNGGSPVIGAMEPFWVVARGKDPVLGINENAKCDTRTFEAADSEKDILRLSMTNGLYQDEVTFYVQDNAQEGFDAPFDAFKLAGREIAPYLACQTPEGYDLAINALQRAEKGTTLPIKALVPEPGSYVFRLEGLEAFANGSCITLEDQLTGEVHILNETTMFTANLQPGDVQPRFRLHIGEPIASEVTHASCYGTDDGRAVIHGSGEGPWNVTWTSESGTVLRQVDNVYGSDVLDNLQPGIYHVLLDGNGVCESTSTRIEILEPEPMDAFAITRAESCPQYSDGRVELVAAGGSGNYSVNWNNGSEGFVLDNVVAGTYTAFIRDGAGCTSTLETVVQGSPDFSSEFETLADVYDLHNGAAVVDFYNVSKGAESFEWNFGDGTIHSDEENPTHLFNKAGNFDVTLYCRNPSCESRFVKNVIIKEPQTDAIGWASDVAVAINRDGISLFFMFDSERDLMINAYNILGQRIMEPLRGSFYTQSLTIGDAQYSTYALVEIKDLNTNETVLIRVGQ